MTLPNRVFFDPARWGEVEKFSRFWTTTYNFPPVIGQCIKGSSSHYHRAHTLGRIAFSMSGSMQEELLELEAKGFSNGFRSSEVAAVVESAVMSLYSSIDAARKVFTFIFSKYRGIPDSTRKTFKAAVDGTIDVRIPAQIRAAFKNADWYPAMRRLRDALTHVGTGSCHLDQASARVVYFHPALNIGDKVLHIPDIFGHLESLFEQVNHFLGQIFSSLNQSLKDKEVWQMCGLFGGRVYSRYVRLSEAVDFNSGRCDSYSWFELPENPRCPFAEKCGAYQKRSRAPLSEYTNTDED
jgi:hypothetical protein